MIESVERALGAAARGCRSRLVALALTASIVVLQGCAYGYAGREGKVVTEQRSATPVEVVKFEDPEAARATNGAEQAERRGAAASPCGVRFFDVHYYSPTTRIVKTIDCVDRTVTNLMRSPVGQTYLQEARAANLPQEIWYVLVDPQGLRSIYVPNEHINRIAQHFRLEFVGRDTVNDLLVYKYLEETP